LRHLPTPGGWKAELATVSKQSAQYSYVTDITAAQAATPYWASGARGSVELTTFRQQAAKLTSEPPMIP